MEEQTNGKKVETPSLEEMLDSEVIGGVNFASEVTKFVDNVSVPKTDKGELDITTFINHLLENSKDVVKSNLSSDTKDPQWFPTAVAYQQIFETYKNPLDKDGKLRKEVKDALVNLYESTAQQYIANRGQGRVNTTTLKEGQPFAKALADKTSNKYLIPLIEAEKRVEQLAARIGPVITEWYQKAKQWKTLYGDMGGFKPAYAGAHADSGKR